MCEGFRSKEVEVGGVCHTLLAEPKVFALSLLGSVVEYGMVYVSGHVSV